MISITSLSKSYGQKHVLRDISLQVHPGETVVILGPSGGGKSTLLRCLMGLTPFDSGHIIVDEHTLSPDIPTAQRRQAIAGIRKRCGLVFQHYNLFPHKTVLENLVLAPIRVIGISREVATNRAMELLEQVGLQDKAAQRPHQLSGGEQQRVAIARALVMQPGYLLYDEPTSALDPDRAISIWKLMSKLAETGQSQVIVTHQEQITSALPCRVLRMADGRLQ